MNHLIFVYGTLQRGELQDLSNLTPKPRFIGEALVKGFLYDLGHCPVLLLSEEGYLVRGELFEISQFLFDELDAWEAQCGEFTLAAAEATQVTDEHCHALTQPKPVRCDIYEGHPEMAVAPMVPEGRWRRGAHA